MEKLAGEYGTDKIILVEEAGWGKYSTTETKERFSWYVPGTKHTPFIAFNGLSDKFSEGVTGGGGGTTPPPANRAPVIISEPITIAIAEELYTYEVEATDSDNDILTYVLTRNPEGMYITSDTGIINWTPTSTQTGEYNVSVKVSDGKKEDIQDFVITVYDENNFLVSEVYAIAITNQITNSEILEKKIEYLKREGKIRDSYQINRPLLATRGTPEYFIEVEWSNTFPDATGYKVYRKNGISSEYELLLTWENPTSEAEWLILYDKTISKDNFYAYYVTAYYDELELETYPSQEVSIDTWLPPCSLSSPIDGSVIAESEPTFTWNPVGLDNFSDGSIVRGDSDLWIYDNTASSTVWWIYFADMTTNSITYNADGRATSLVSGHSYSWESWGYGYDVDDNLIAMSWSEDWDFTTWDLGLSTVQRALLVGVGDYINSGPEDGDLPAPPYDVAMMRDTLEHSGVELSLINELIDQQATKSAILSSIASTFNEADSDDISYFYFTGHGTLSGEVSYLCPTDFDGYLISAISVNELESALNAIAGTKVIFIDSCRSGGFIGKEINIRDVSDFSKSFNDSIISTFMAKGFTKKDLAHSQYQVLTSCLSTQYSTELIPSEGNPFGLFSRVLCDGCGYDYYTHPYNADLNANGEVTLNEAYLYTDFWVDYWSDELNALHGWNIDQDTQVYPEDSYFVIIEEYRE